MSQEINLFSPVFRKQRISLTAAHVVALCALTVLGMIGLWFYEQQVVAGLREDLRSVRNLVTTQRAHVERIAKSRAGRQNGTALEREIARLETQLQLMREQRAALQAGAAGEGRGFAEYLRAFSRQSLEGLWLTGFDITGEGEITIRGRALRAGLVPDYIQRLDREAVLRGRSFAALNMERPALDSATVVGKKEAAMAPRFLEFSLATAQPKTHKSVSQAERPR